MNNRERIDRLEKEGTLSREEFSILIYSFTEGDRAYAAEKARNASLSNYGNKVYFRGLIEISNYCKNDCYYCGIRNGNQRAVRGNRGGGRAANATNLKKKKMRYAHQYRPGIFL